MNEQKDQARQIVFNYYLSKNLFALFLRFRFSANKEIDKQEKREFEHHILDIMLNKAEKEPEKIIDMYNKEQLSWWIIGTIRNQIWNNYSTWNRWNNDGRMEFYGSFENLIDVIDNEQGIKNGEPIIWLEL